MFNKEYDTEMAITGVKVAKTDTKWEKIFKTFQLTIYNALHKNFILSRKPLNLLKTNVRFNML